MVIIVTIVRRVTIDVYSVCLSTFDKFSVYRCGRIDGIIKGSRLKNETRKKEKKRRKRKKEKNQEKKNQKDQKAHFPRRVLYVSIHFMQTLVNIHKSIIVSERSTRER